MKRKKGIMITVTKEINGQEYLNMSEAADYLGYSQTQTQLAVREYEDQVGYRVRTRDGRDVYVSKADLNAILMVRRPFEARRRGLIKDE